MKSLSEEDKQKSLLSYIDEEPAANVLVCDRSLAERYATCPLQARAIADGRINSASAIAESGEQVHRAFSQATTDFIESHGMESPRDVREFAESVLRHSRPDVQPDALQGAKRSLYEWANWLHKIHPDNILHYDGGEGDRCGQLSWDYKFGRDTVRVTSELDFVHAGPSPKCLHEVDYKSGHKIWTAADVQASFQFTLHAVLLLRKYEEIDGVEVTIWNTRINRRTFPTTFYRKKLGEYEARVQSACSAFYQHRSSQNPPTWPTLEKCSICPAAGICHVADEDIVDVAENPAAFVDKLIAVDARLSRMKKLAAAYVDQHGEIEATGGVMFGRNKPRTERKPTAAIYTKKATEGAA